MASQTTVQLKRSSVSGKIPDSANVEVGEPVVNLADKKVFTKNGSGDIIQIASGNLQGLADVSNATPLTNQVLSWNGTTWAPGNVQSSGVDSVNGATGTVILTTANIEESSNLYFTNARVYSNVTPLIDTKADLSGATFTGNVHANYFIGDGSALTNLPTSTGGGGGGGGNFNTAINNNLGYDLTTTSAAAFTAPSTEGIRYIIHSIHITNINTIFHAEVTGSFDGTTYSSNISFSNTIPVPIGSSVELLKKPKVLQPNDRIQLNANVENTLNSVITYETQSSTDYFGTGVDITGTATFTTLHTASGNSVIESILLSNDDGVLDVKARVAWTDGADVIQGYYAYDLIIPADATIEILEQPKYLPNGHKIQVYANQPNRLEAILSGRTQ
jgi:hypothetical protein